MARYIDLEELVKRINENIKPETLEEKALIEWCKDECIRQAYAMPTADVVPKSEIARKIISEFAELTTKYVKDRGLYLAVFKYAIANAEAALKKKYVDEDG